MDYVLTKYHRITPLKYLVRVILIATLLFFFLVSLGLIGINAKMLGADVLNQITNATSNPFIGLFIGLLATAILQSSSTTTAIIVAMVASGTISLYNAVPIVMGANVGTTITSLIVALSHITRRHEFGKAIATATSHSLFNIFTVLLIFPLHFYTDFLTISAEKLSHWLFAHGFTKGVSFNFLKECIEAVVNPLYHFLPFKGVYALAFSFGMLYTCIIALTFIIKAIRIEDTKRKLEQLIFSNVGKSLSWGVLLTVLMQSSSLICSVVVPIVATGKTTVKKAFPLLLGANIGTTFTAILAAFSRSEAALSIAFVHLLFNLLGVFLVFIIPNMRNLIVYVARKIGYTTACYRLVGFAYILLVFFLIPFLLILLNKNHRSVTKYTPKVEQRYK